MGWGPGLWASWALSAVTTGTPTAAHTLTQTLAHSHKHTLILTHSCSYAQLHTPTLTPPGSHSHQTLPLQCANSPLQGVGSPLPSPPLQSAQSSSPPSGPPCPSFWLSQWNSKNRQFPAHPTTSLLLPFPGSFGNREKEARVEAGWKPNGAEQGAGQTQSSTQWGLQGPASALQNFPGPRSFREAGAWGGSRCPCPPPPSPSHTDAPPLVQGPTYPTVTIGQPPPPRVCRSASRPTAVLCVGGTASGACRTLSSAPGQAWPVGAQSQGPLMHPPLSPTLLDPEGFACHLETSPKSQERKGWPQHPASSRPTACLHCS